MQISALCTLADWTHTCGLDGPVGVERIFDWLHVARMRRIYWRIFNGGRINFKSKIAQPLIGKELENGAWCRVGEGGGPSSRRYFKHIDATEWDQFDVAVQCGRERGIEVCAWWTLCEEDHGGHLLSGFGARRDIRMHDREGNDYPGTVEFYFKEVQQRRLAVLDEILERNPDGVLLDFIRHNATPSGDARGIHRFGYNPEIRAAYKRKQGVDPRDLKPDDPDWLAFKNDYRAAFVRKIRRRIGKKRRLDVMTIPHVDNYRWLCLDLPTLTRDNTVQLVVPTDMTHCNNPQTITRQVKGLKKQVKGKAKVGASVQAYWGNLEPDAFDDALHAAEKAGADTMMIYESDHLIQYKLLTPTRAHHLGVSRRSRQVKVKRLRRKPTAADWRKVKAHTGFLAYTGVDRVKASSPTVFRILANARALYLRIECKGKQQDPSEALIREKKIFIDWIGARNYWMRDDRAHLLLDPGPTRRRFHHFSAGRDGSKLQETRTDNHHDVEWNVDIDAPAKSTWSATLEIPFNSLGVTPNKGDRWGFQVLREQCAKGEVSSWFATTAFGLDAGEWGDLIFDQ